MSKSAQLYEIRVQGHLSPRRLCCYEGMTVTHRPDGQTVLVCPVADQAALHGLLGWLQSIGVVLVSIRRLEDTSS
jgi:hypothetical protein